MHTMLHIFVSYAGSLVIMSCSGCGYFVHELRSFVMVLVTMAIDVLWSPGHLGTSGGREGCQVSPIPTAPPPPCRLCVCVPWSGGGVGEGESG